MLDLADKFCLPRKSTVRSKLAAQDGNVESSMVLIPLLLLFLIGIQVIIAINMRNSDVAIVQGDASSRAISHELQSGDQVIEIGGGVQKVRLLITHRSNTLPQIVPGLVALFGGSPQTDVIGVAVLEPVNP